MRVLGCGSQAGWLDLFQIFTPNCFMKELWTGIENTERRFAPLLSLVPLTSDLSYMEREKDCFFNYPGKSI
jgi:hypothetical protein